MNQSAPPKLPENPKNFGTKCSGILWSIVACKKLLEKVVEVTIKQNEQEIKEKRIIEEHWRESEGGNSTVE